MFAEAAQEGGLPPGVLNIVPGAAEAGVHLVSHPGVDKVSFTGSTAAGRAIGEVCGRLLRPVTLELGGKSAAIILDDADLDATMKGLRSASFVNNGQTCYLSSRIPAPRSRYDDVVAALVALVDGMKVGDPLDPATDIGPLVSARQRERVLGYIEAGRNSDAKLVVGARFRPISRAAGSSRRRSSPTCTTRIASRRRRSSGRCWPSFPMTGTPRRSRWPTTASSGWPARSGPATTTGPPRWPARSAPEPSGSTTTSWTSGRRSAG